MTREEFMYELNDLLKNYKKGIIIPSNKIILNGTPMGEVTLFTTNYLVGYRFTLAVKRKNRDGKIDVDYLEIVVPIENEYMFNKKAKRMQIIGKVCSTFIGHKLQFYVEVIKMGYDEELVEDVNWLYLVGNVVKEPRLKETFRGLKVCNLDLKVFNLREMKRNYMPCVAFNGSAERFYQLNQWTRISIFGRLSSRFYNTESREQKLTTEIVVFYFQ